MALYVPGTEETDPKKQNQSLQLLAGAITTNAANIATNTAAIAAIGTSFTNSLGADVLMNNTANYFPGPTVAQGSVGTWEASGTVTIDQLSGGAPNLYAKLWDGTTVIASGVVGGRSSTTGRYIISLSGVIASPAGNIRIDCRDANATTNLIVFNLSGNSKDSTITAKRIA